MITAKRFGSPSLVLILLIAPSLGFCAGINPYTRWQNGPPIRDGEFTDTFKPYEVHLYRISE